MQYNLRIAEVPMLSFSSQKMISCLTLSVVVLGCKAYRPDKGLHENFVNKRNEREEKKKVPVPTPAPTPTAQPIKKEPTPGPTPTTLGTETILGTSFRVSSLGLHTGVELFDRTSLTLKSEGLPDQAKPDYKLGEMLKIEEGKTYTVVVRLYHADKLVFSNETCDLNNDFVAQEGQNVHSIPICVKRADQ